MLSSLQGKMQMARSQKFVEVNCQTSNLMWFKRNQAKDHKDTAKKPTVRNNYAIEIY